MHQIINNGLASYVSVIPTSQMLKENSFINMLEVTQVNYRVVWVFDSA